MVMPVQICVYVLIGAAHGESVHQGVSPKVIQTGKLTKQANPFGQVQIKSHFI